MLTFKEKSNTQALHIFFKVIEKQNIYNIQSYPSHSKLPRFIVVTTM
jgi:hypothetical protein